MKQNFQIKLKESGFIKPYKGDLDMRFSIDVDLLQEEIPKDYRKMIVSFFKKAFEDSNPEYYKKQYVNEENKMKEFVFSVFMERPDIKKDNENISVPDKRIKIFFSSYNPEDGLNIYNALMLKQDKIYKYKDFQICPRHIRLVREKTIRGNEVTFKTLSPVVIKEHKGDNKTTWYHKLDSEAGREQFGINLKNQLKVGLGKGCISDYDEIRYEVIKNKELKIKHYDIIVNCNMAEIKFNAKPYILDYLYKAGVGSNRSRGFGCLDIIKEG